MTALAPGVVEAFRELVARRLGLQFEAAKLGFLAGVLERRIGALACSSEHYLSALASRCAELGPLARELTVGETYFFRNSEQFHALREVALCERTRARSSERVLRLLSAGCASGEELYSLALVVREQIPLGTPWRIELRGVDLNPAMLDRARDARYSEWSLREMPAELAKRWLVPSGREYVVDPALREMVVIEEGNLADDDPNLWQPGRFDVVFCRNVLMYFRTDAARALVKRIFRSLAPGAYLFLGHAETLRGLSDDFHLCHTHGTFYYQRPDVGASRKRPAREAFQSESPAAPLAPIEATASWVETIRAATERVRSLESSTLGDDVSTDLPSRCAVSRAGTPEEVRRAIDLFRCERYGEALALVAGLPSEVRREPEILRLRAVLLAHSGAVIDTENACFELLHADERSASAHYVLALCREAVGDLAGALEHARTAAGLEPDFAMPRLHLGLLAQRAGEHAAARDEFARALSLLEREVPSRLLLFGGGFSRDALVSLARSGLMACGGEP